MMKLNGHDRWAQVSKAGRSFANAVSVDTVIEMLCEAAFEIVGADGVTLAHRDGDEVVILGEEAAPSFLFGRRFAIDRSLSGLAMLEGKPVLVPEIRNDPRVPLNAYLATYLSTVVVFPVGRGEAMAAVGIYWTEFTQVTDEMVHQLDALVRSAGATIEGLRLRADVAALLVSEAPLARIAAYSHAAAGAVLH